MSISYMKEFSELITKCLRNIKVAQIMNPVRSFDLTGFQSEIYSYLANIADDGEVLGHSDRTVEVNFNGISAIFAGHDGNIQIAILATSAP